MPIPTQFSDLSATIASNSPAGSDNVFPDLDNYLRAHAGLIKQLYDGDGEFLQAGTGATSRTVQAKLRDVVSVKDFGAVGDGSVNDAPAIQTAINNNPGKRIYFPPGFYRVESTITVNSNGTRLVTDGRVFFYAPVGNFDVLHFVCPTNGQYEYLNNCALDGRFYIYTDASSVATVGAGVRLTRCQLFMLRDVYILNMAEGLTIEGGQNGSYIGFGVAFDPASRDLSGITDSYQIKLTDSPTAGGTYQPCWTMRFTDVECAPNYRTQCALLVTNVDGLQFSTAYLSGAKQSVVRLKNSRAGSYIASVTISDTYLDAINQTTGSNTCIDIPDDALASNVYNVSFSNCFLGNCVTDAVTVTKTTTELQFTGCVIANVNGTAVNFTGATANSGNLQLTGCKLQGTGVLAGASSAVRIGNAGSVNLVGNKIDSHSGTNSAIRLDGTIADATIVGNGVRMSSGTDFQNVGTVTRLVLDGNNSNLTTSALQGVRTGNKANADATVLDWYEEGAITPTIRFGGASVGVTYTAQSGTFTRIGNRVHFSLALTLSSKGSSTGALSVEGLPYAVGATTAVSLRVTNVTAGVADGSVMAIAVGTSTGIRIDKITTGSTFVVQLTDADISNTFAVTIAGTYAV